MFNEVLETRLCERLAWRGSTEPATIRAQVAFNQWLKKNAAATEPPIELLATTAAGEVGMAAAVARWIG